MPPIVLERLNCVAHGMVQTVDWPLSPDSGEDPVIPSSVDCKIRTFPSVPFSSFASARTNESTSPGLRGNRWLDSRDPEQLGERYWWPESHYYLQLKRSTHLARRS